MSVFSGGTDWIVFADESLTPADARALQSGDEKELLLADERKIVAQTGDFDRENQRLNLRNVYSDAQWKAQIPVICMTTFESAEAAKAILGVGSDWWCEALWNGESVISTLASGNNESPVSGRDHLQQVNVRSGKNLLVMYVRSGSGGFSAAAALMQPEPSLMARISRRKTLEAIRPNCATILHRSFITRPGATSAQINFITDGNIACGVDWRVAGEKSWNRQWELLGGQVRNDRDYHKFFLDGLRPATNYEFRPVMLNPDNMEEIYGTAEVFTTLAAADDATFSFFVVSDLQFSVRKRRELLEQFWNNTPFRQADFLVSLGDLTSAVDNFRQEYHLGGTDLISQLAMQDRQFLMPMVAVRGNHEFRGQESNWFFQNFSWSDERCYGAFRVGDVMFLVLDSGEDKPRDVTEAPYTRYTFEAPLIEAQREWLHQLVKTEDFQTAKFRVVLAHGPSHGEGDSYTSRSLQRICGDLFYGKNAPYKIQLYLAGHTHFYTRMVQQFSTEQMGFAAEQAILSPLESADIPYILVVNDGPNTPGPDTTGIWVSRHDNVLEVQSYLPDGNSFDHFTVDETGHLEELGTQLQRIPATK